MAIVLVVAISIGINMFSNNNKSSKVPTSSRIESSATASSEKLLKMRVESALLNKIKERHSKADPGSTKYKINKTEKGKQYTTFYGKVYLYDKYGKATTGYSDNSGNFVRTFEVKIDNDTYKVKSCSIK